MDTEINSRVASVGDTFLTSVIEPVKVRGTITVPSGTFVEGRITGVKPAADFNRSGSLELVFETLLLEKAKRHIEGVLVSDSRSPSTVPFKSVSIVTGSMDIGWPEGDKRKGGRSIGAVLGSLISLFRKGSEARISSGTTFEIELKKEVILPVLDY